MALLVAETRRATHVGLVEALTAHYRSPGRLADYRRQFDKTTRQPEEDPSIFAMALETLAVKAFRDMGNTARLRIIRDHFIAGHASCELRLHLDSVAPKTHIRDIVDRCRVWESHTDSDNRRGRGPGPERALPIYMLDEGGGRDDRAVAAVAAVATSPTTPEQLESLPPPPPTPVPSELRDVCNYLGQYLCVETIYFLETSYMYFTTPFGILYMYGNVKFILSKRLMKSGCIIL